MRPGYGAGSRNYAGVPKLIVRRLTMRIGKLRTVAGILSWIAGAIAGRMPVRRSRRRRLRLRRLSNAPRRWTRRAKPRMRLWESSRKFWPREIWREMGGSKCLSSIASHRGMWQGAGSANPSPIFVTRAAILEKNDGKWAQVLLCDEHLKNPNGYLGGSPAARVTGWRLEYSQDAKEGLEMKFTPAERFDAVNVNADQNSESKYPTFDVRWNGSAKRYQSFDQSHERYLSEVPSLETPVTILK